MYKILKIYFDNSTGEVLHRALYNYEASVNFEADYQGLICLNERVKDTIGLIILKNGLYEQDFKECTNIKINIKILSTLADGEEYKALEFSYPDPDPNEPDAPQEFRPPLSVEVENLKAEDLNNKEAIAELYMMSMGGF